MAKVIKTFNEKTLLGCPISDVNICETAGFVDVLGVVEEGVFGSHNQVAGVLVLFPLVGFCKYCVTGLCQLSVPVVSSPMMPVRYLATALTAAMVVT